MTSGATYRCHDCGHSHFGRPAATYVQNANRPRTRWNGPSRVYQTCPSCLAKATEAADRSRREALATSLQQYEAGLRELGLSEAEVAAKGAEMAKHYEATR